MPYIILYVDKGSIDTGEFHASDAEEVMVIHQEEFEAVAEKRVTYNIDFEMPQIERIIEDIMLKRAGIIT